MNGLTSSRDDRTILNLVSQNCLDFQKEVDAPLQYSALRHTTSTRIFTHAQMRVYETKAVFIITAVQHETMFYSGIAVHFIELFIVLEMNCWRSFAGEAKNRICKEGSISTVRPISAKKI